MTNEQRVRLDEQAAKAVQACKTNPEILRKLKLSAAQVVREMEDKKK